MVTYLAIKKENGGLTKIGKSIYPKTRMSQLKSNPVYYIDGDFETELHEFFDHKRVDGEWFFTFK